MAVSEESRHRLYGRLEELLGCAEAATLMEHLPPVGWADVATKRDLDHLSEVLRGELAVIRTEIDAGLASLRAEIHTGLASLGAETDTGLASVRAELASLGAGFQGDLARASLDTRAGLRTMFLGLAGLQVSGAALALAVARAA